MKASDTPVVVYVTYHGTPDDRFDRDYYISGHLPLVMDAWGKYGLLSLQAFFPAVDRVGTVAICECVFRDEDAVETAFGSPELAGVMDDLPRFTQLAPSRVRAVPV
ncbi:EthD family reductase [Luteibacter sp. 329MFSha]|uniref:EthD family reductase n=1 Tax=Luteibacter sp. 329MFSha TaxID=1798239 RepID=UPI0008B1DF1E|nr:EthD family reductase [Luteibacter sp. 329MFSha]SEV92198.1 conserved hypothetical protein [Luteibacter sp. 329MFSha]